MSPELVINLVQNALYILIIVSAPWWNTPRGCFRAFPA